ncbi:MAG TPA: hypothetical protein VFG68_12500 [Fimbriiglobus sp.]|nr:hypothetical protein [Fimbriiglobus sp.]
MIPTISSPTRIAQAAMFGSASDFAQCESNASLVRGIVTAIRFESGSSCRSYIRGRSPGSTGRSRTRPLAVGESFPNLWAMR